MADYYPLISRALDGLSDKSPDMRRAVYERARAALMAQLQSLDPPLPAAEITRERLALDEAIDRVEAEYTPREPPRTPAAPPAQSPPTTPPPATPADVPRGTLPEAGPPSMRGRPESARDPIPERDFDELAFEDAPSPPFRERPRVGTVTRVRADQGRGRAIILGTVLVVVMGLIAAAAWLLRVQPSDFQEQPAVEASKTPEGDTKLSDRVTGDRPPSAAPAPAPVAPGAVPPRSDVPVAQRAILYEENQADPQNPKASPGRALWRLDALNPGQGQALETVVRASIEAPPAGLTLALSVRRNTDSTLPASHIVELTFTTSDDPNRIIRDVGLLQFKSEEAVRGTPLAGLPVPVKDNVFLIGLSNLPGDMERNRELMLRRNWIDLPIRFASGQRAILSFEKGVSGDQVINDAFRQWQER
jgi:hypothetical protein